VAQATNTRAPACTRAASYRVCGPLGGVGYLDERFVEYDLDSEDERWLGALNGGQDRLPPRRLESLIWRLELANAEATDRALAGAGEQAIKYEFRKINHVAMRFAWSTSLVARRAVSAHTHSLTCRLPPGGRCRGCPASWSAPPTRGQAAARLGVTEITQCWTIPMQDSDYVRTTLAAEGLRCSAQRCMSGMGLTRPVSRGRRARRRDAGRADEPGRGGRHGAPVARGGIRGARCRAAAAAPGARRRLAWMAACAPGRLSNRRSSMKQRRQFRACLALCPCLPATQSRARTRQCEARAGAAAPAPQSAHAQRCAQPWRQPGASSAPQTRRLFQRCPAARAHAVPKQVGCGGRGAV